ncbi:hypothetical protein ABZ746_23805 [Streptomyces sp. NPDC020096]
MRVRDIRIGQTYQIKVPQRLPAALRNRLPRTREEFAASMQLHQRRGDRFELTVTGVADDGKTVDGYETTSTSRVTLPLTAEQAERLGLPIGPAYEIDGHVTDDDGNDVALPVTVTYTDIPAAWVRPLEEPVPISPASVRFFRAQVREKATGMPAEDIARAADDAQEHERDVAARALDS